MYYTVEYLSINKVVNPVPYISKYLNFKILVLNRHVDLHTFINFMECLNFTTEKGVSQNAFGSGSCIWI